MQLPSQVNDHLVQEITTLFDILRTEAIVLPVHINFSTCGFLIKLARKLDNFRLAEKLYSFLIRSCDEKDGPIPTSIYENMISIAADHHRFDMCYAIFDRARAADPGVVHHPSIVHRMIRVAIVMKNIPYGIDLYEDFKISSAEMDWDFCMTALGMHACICECIYVCMCAEFSNAQKDCNGYERYDCICWVYMRRYVCMYCMYK